MRRMEKVTGRSDDMIILRGVNVFPTQIEEMLLRCPALSPHTMIELTREGRLDEIDVHRRGARRTLPTPPRAPPRRARLRSTIKDTIGVSAQGAGRATPARSSARPARPSARESTERPTRTCRWPAPAPPTTTTSAARSWIARPSLFAATRLRPRLDGKIAAACGVSKALLYHYYEDKEALLFDVIRVHLQELLEVVRDADQHARSPRGAAADLVGALLDAYRDADAAAPGADQRDVVAAAGAADAR